MLMNMRAKMVYNTQNLLKGQKTSLASDLKIIRPKTVHKKAAKFENRDLNSHVEQLKRNIFKLPKELKVPY